jgi:hypothetical protein
MSCDYVTVTFACKYSHVSNIGWFLLFIMFIFVFILLLHKKNMQLHATIILPEETTWIQH